VAQRWRVAGFESHALRVSPLDEPYRTDASHPASTRRSARARRNGGGVRHGRLRRSHPVATIAKALATLVVVALISSVSVAAIATWDVARTVRPGIQLVKLPGSTATAGPIPQIGAIKGGVNLLLVGTDTRTGQGGAYESDEELEGSSGAGNNDVTILMHIAQDHKSATIVSFPRDLMIPVPSCPSPDGGSYSSMSNQMLNTALTYGGLPCPVLTISKLMDGLDIPFAAEISFDGVAAMSNAVGGVTVCLATPVKDPYTNPQLDLPAGEQEIVGDVALSFLRSRHGVGDGSDLGRISNQQVFLSALVRKIKSGGVLSNPLELYPLAKAAVSNMRLSDTLSSPSTMVQIALALKDINLSNVVFLQYPVYTDPDNVNRVVPDRSSAQVLVDALQADQPVQLTGTTGRASEAVPTDPTAVPDASPAPDATAPAPTDGTPPATPPATDTGVVQLPSDIVGQTASQQTCSKGNGDGTSGDDNG
jgi:LCP family protein required for cell wall assembly